MAGRQARLFRGWLTVSRAGGEPHSATATKRTTNGVGVGQHDTRRSSQRLRRCGWRAYPAAISRVQITQANKSKAEKHTHQWSNPGFNTTVCLIWNRQEGELGLST